MNLIKNLRPDIGKIYLYTKNPFKSKNQLVITRNSRIKKLKNPIVYIDYSLTIDDVYENLEDYNPTKKRRSLNDMIADMESNKQLRPIVTELLLRDRNAIFNLLLAHSHIWKCLKR